MIKLTFRVVEGYETVMVKFIILPASDGVDGGGGDKIPSTCRPLVKKFNLAN